jgi:hypothetical protein
MNKKDYDKDYADTLSKQGKFRCNSCLRELELTAQVGESGKCQRCHDAQFMFIGSKL